MLAFRCFFLWVYVSNFRPVLLDGVCFRQACAIKELDLILGGFADTLFG
jgi:hypothetical protein